MTPDDELAEAVLALVRDVVNATRSKPKAETSLVVSLDYERYIEAPRRAGIDPTFRSLMAQATESHNRMEGAA